MRSSRNLHVYVTFVVACTNEDDGSNTGDVEQVVGDHDRLPS